jgi:predicted MPP superfamily phosphohydrolase
MLFFVLLSGVVAAINRYLWQRLVRDTRLGRPASAIVTWLLIALSASVPLALSAWMLISRSFSPLLNYLAFGWLGLSFYMLLLFALWDLLRALRWLGRRSLPLTAAAPAPQAVTETRRVFVARSVAGGVLAAAGGIGTFGVRSALWDITTPETAVALPRLPRALDGFSIALITDVHIGPLLDGRFLQHLVEQTNRLRPDLIAIGGDLVDGWVSQIGPQLAPLARLRARHGVYFVTGNHEYYSGVDDWLVFLKRLGIRVLLNERVSIGQGGTGARAGAGFDLAGVPDFRAGHAGGIAPDLAATVQGRDPERELVVMAHQPLAIEASNLAGAGLQLSGHTHGGQLYPFGALTRIAQPYIAGLYRHRATDTQIYVSCGSGFWGPPMRVLAPAEISLLRLFSA